MREAVSFSVVLKSNIWVGEYNTMNQHNCKKISQLRKKCTTAKKIAQQRNSTQESQKKLAQLRKKWHNCETKCTTAKKKHNCETHLLQLYIFWQYLTIVLIVLFTFPFLFYLFPRSHVTHQRLSTSCRQQTPPAIA